MAGKDFVPPPQDETFAGDLCRRFEPWLTRDLETYLRAVASMFDQTILYAFDTDDYEGWSILFDPTRCPYEALPYLAQLVGEILPEGLSEIQAREWVMDAPNQRRGTPRAVFSAAQRRLTGSRLVTVKERDGAVDQVTVITYTSETPNPAGTQADILSVLPADVILNHVVSAGIVWSDVKAGYATWADVKATGKTWGELKAGTAGQSTFGRPRPTW